MRGAGRHESDRRPLLIARCTCPEDVQLALRHAREQELVVAVRGGGHSSPGYSCCDDGVVIDVSPMKRVEIDVDRRTGRFGAGLTWGELDAATQAHGLAVTGGRVTHTGVAGLSLGSGSRRTRSAGASRSPPHRPTTVCRSRLAACRRRC